MKNVLKKMENIKALMAELQSELASLPSLQVSMSDDLCELEKESQDILHIHEAFTLTDEEKTKFSDRMTRIREVRRENKTMIKLVQSVKHSTTEVRHVIDVNMSNVEEAIAEAQHDYPYVFRSQAIFDMMKEVCGSNYGERSKTYLLAPSTPKTTTLSPSHVSVPQETEPTPVVPTATVAPVLEVVAPVIEETVEPVIEKVERIPVIDDRITPETNCHVTFSNDEWQLRDKSLVLVSSSDVTDLVLYVEDNQLEYLNVMPGATRQLKSEVSETKRLENDYDTLQAFSRFQRKAFKKF